MAAPGNHLQLKFSLEDGIGQSKDIRRLAPKPDELKRLEDLKDKVRALYPQLGYESFQLCYIDDEKDEVTVSSDEELFAAVLLAKRRRNKPLHFIVRIVEREDDYGYDYE